MQSPSPLRAGERVPRPRPTGRRDLTPPLIAPPPSPGGRDSAPSGSRNQYVFIGWIFFVIISWMYTIGIGYQYTVVAYETGVTTYKFVDWTFAILLRNITTTFVAFALKSRNQCVYADRMFALINGWRTTFRIDYQYTFEAYKISFILSMLIPFEWIFILERRSARSRASSPVRRVRPRPS